MTVPDDLLLNFFRETTSSLLEIDASEVVPSSTEKDNSHLELADCRRCVLDQQIMQLNKTTKNYDDSSVSPSQVQERLSQLQHEEDLSSELRDAMETMNDAARIAVSKLILYSEEVYNQGLSIPRKLQDEGRLDRTQLMEYFGLCQSSLKLPCVLEFLETTGATLVFSKLDSKSENEAESSVSSALQMFPQSRLEYVQRLLAKGMGWDPVHVTSELRKIFVERSSDIDFDYYNVEITDLFQQLVGQMTDVIRAATLRIKSKQDTELLNDLGKGGSTRVLSVQYSEFEVDQHGNKINSKTNAPGMNQDEREEQISDEQKKRRLRVASEAAIMQQTILGELFGMSDDERKERLEEAAQTSQEFTQKLMALPPGPERIMLLRNLDPATSRKLAMHKLWAGMLQANGGQPPNFARKL